MNCIICKNGETAPGTMTVALQREGATVIVKDVSANVCENCGEYCLDEPTASRVFDVADAAAKGGAEVEIRRYAA
jgi:YgiT-type zinc finger domain-containing protein